MAVRFSDVKKEYEQLAAIGAANSTNDVARFHSAAHKLLRFKSRYATVSEKTGVPILWYMVINERESSSDFHTYLGNGDPLGRRTTHVPAGRGPFSTWEDGAVDATVYDHVATPGPDGWTWPWFLYRCEAWNGFGPRMHGRYSGYLWAGTRAYNTPPCGGGKYVSDGVWDPNAHDTQLGVYGMARALIEIDTSLALLPTAFTTPWASVPDQTPATAGGPSAQPAQLTGVRWIQTSLNTVAAAGLLVDSSYGRHTRAAVRAFQSAHGLSADGVCGGLTCAALDAELNKMSKLPVNQNTGQSGRTTMDLTNIVNLANMVAPKFATALASTNPLLSLAVNMMGDALKLQAPHTVESVATAAASPDVRADVLANAIQSAAAEYAKHVASAAAATSVTTSTPVAASVPASTADTSTRQTGGVFVSPMFTGILHGVTGVGTWLLASGFLDPNGPLAGFAKGSPLLGLLLTVGGPILNTLLVTASNKATATKLGQ
jgi:lysozyme family protein/peptidoglycan hydrolase-like protein with peptidoglycan-binding domain